VHFLKAACCYPRKFWFSANLGLFVFIIANTSFAQIDEVEAISDLESYRIQIEELEYSLGRYDLQLIEPILRLADTAAALNQFDEVAYILDRAVQIVRVNEGLYAESQIPILKQHIENDVRRGNWTDASATMDHLYWLYTEKSTGTSDEVIQGLRDLSDRIWRVWSAMIPLIRQFTTRQLP